MQPSDNYVKLMIELEGFNKCPYVDSAGIITIGVGSTHYEDGTPVRISDTCITYDRAVSLLMLVTNSNATLISAIVKSSINQNQFDALLAFTYNEGQTAFKTSTLLKRININPNDVNGITDAFLMWVYAKDPTTGTMVKSKGLINRRNQEIKLYFTPVTTS